MFVKLMITNLQVEACVSILKVERHEKKIWWVNKIKNENYKAWNNEININKKKEWKWHDFIMIKFKTAFLHSKFRMNRAS